MKKFFVLIPLIIAGCGSDFTVHYRAFTTTNMALMDEGICLNATNRFLSADGALPDEIFEQMTSDGYRTDAPYNLCTMEVMVKNAPGFDNVKETFSAALYEKGDQEKVASVVAVVMNKNADKYRAHILRVFSASFGKTASWEEKCRVNLFFKDAGCKILP